MGNVITVNSYSPGLFNKKLELINFLIPVIFLFCSLSDLYYGYRYLPAEKVYLRILCQIFLFNGIHVVFTFFFICFSAEFKAFIVEESRLTNSHIIKKWCFVFGVFSFFSILLGSFLFFSKSNSNYLLYFGIYQMLFFYYSFYHGAGQSHGLSMLYTMHFQSKTNQPRSVISAKFEKTIKSHIVICITVLTALVLFKRYDYCIKGAFIFFISILVHLLIILYLIYKDSAHLFKIKLIHFARYLLYPLSFLSPMAAAGLSSVHGMEYVMISEKIFKKGVFKIKWNQVFIVLVCAVYIVFEITSVLGGLFAIETASTWPNKRFFLISFTILNAVTLTHYYIDAQLYKIKSSSFKRNQGKLIIDV